MRKSYILVEVLHTPEEDKMNILAGTESKVCALRALEVYKSYKNECVKRGIDSQTLIRSGVVDDPEYNVHIESTVKPTNEDETDRLLSMVDLDK